jgi:hypothetical protein
MCIEQTILVSLEILQQVLLTPKCKEMCCILLDMEPHRPAQELDCWFSNRRNSFAHIHPVLINIFHPQFNHLIPSVINFYAYKTWYWHGRWSHGFSACTSVIYGSLWPTSFEVESCSLDGSIWFCWGRDVCQLGHTPLHAWVPWHWFFKQGEMALEPDVPLSPPNTHARARAHTHTYIYIHIISVYCSFTAVSNPHNKSTELCTFHSHIKSFYSLVFPIFLSCC